MKFTFLGISAFASYKFVPSFGLLIAMAICIGLDFLTGIYKAKMLKQARTSEGFRRTIAKAVNYLIAVAASCVLVFVSEQKGGSEVKVISNLLNDGLVVFIIYIEVTSIFENLYAVDKRSMFSKYFFAPVLKLLTFQIKNNPIFKQAEALKDTQEITPDPTETKTR
jgi:phage-related holin